MPDLSVAPDGPFITFITSIFQRLTAEEATAWGAQQGQRTTIYASASINCELRGDASCGGRARLYEYELARRLEDCSA
jgi:hypothetical protein